MLQVVVQLLPDVLGAFLPGPEVDLDEVHAGLEIQILQDVGRRDLVKIAVAERGEGPDPDLLHQGNAVELAEILERHRQVLQVRVLALYALAAGGHGIAVIAAFGHTPVPVEVIALVLGLQQLAEGGQLLLHLQQPGVADEIGKGLRKRLNDVAAAVLVIAVQLRAVVRDAAELFDILHRIVGGDAHDGAHFIPASVVMRAPALAAHAVQTLKNRVVFIALLLQIHTGAQTGRAAADNGDANVFVHSFPPFLFFMSVFSKNCHDKKNYTTTCRKYHYTL